MPPTGRENSPAFIRGIERERIFCERFRQQQHQTRWRRRLEFAVRVFLVPFTSVPIAFNVLSWLRPPAMLDNHSFVWATLLAMAISCYSGWVYGGAIAITLIFGTIAWDLRAKSYQEWVHWLWWGTLLLSYASVLALLYFKPHRGPFSRPPFGPFAPKGGAALFRSLATRLWSRRRGPSTDRRSHVPRADRKRSHGDPSGDRRFARLAADD